MMFNYNVVVSRLSTLNYTIYRSLSSVTTPIKKYNSLLKEGILKPDKSQFLAMLKLQDLYNDLKSYSLIMDSERKNGIEYPGLFIVGKIMF